MLLVVDHYFGRLMAAFAGKALFLALKTLLCDVP
jgi:hypothetical protein